jgi:hypothetical protein
MTSQNGWTVSMALIGSITAQPAHPTVADHRAAPPSRLQGAAEPSPPLTEQCLAQPVVLSQ